MGREDGKHVTRTGSHTLRFDSARALMNLIADMVPAGARRDALMVRPFLVTLLPQFGPKFLKDGEAVRREKLELAKPLVDAYWTGEVAHRLRVHERLRLQLVAMGRPDLLVEVLEFMKAKKTPETVLEKGGRRVYFAYPFFRDPSTGLPDALYLAEPREAREVPGYREIGVDQLLRRAVRKARRVLTPAG